MRVNLTPKDLASSEIVIVGDKATVSYYKNSNGSIITFPVLIDYPGSDADFRIEYYEKLVELTKEEKLPSIYILKLEQSKNAALLDEDTYEALKLITNFADNQAQKLIEEKEELLRDLSEKSRNDFILKALKCKGKGAPLGLVFWFFFGYAIVASIIEIIKAFSND